MIITGETHLKVQRLWRNKQPWIGAHSDHKQLQKTIKKRESKEREPSLWERDIDTNGKWEQKREQRSIYIYIK